MMDGDMDYKSQITTNWSPIDGYGVKINLPTQSIPRKGARQVIREINRAIHESEEWEQA